MNKQIPHEIIDRASEWFIEMRETDISDTEREAFTEWLRASPAHVQAYLEVASIWGDASQVSKELTVEFASEATNVVAFEKGDFSSASLPLRVEKGRDEKREERAGKAAASPSPLGGSAEEREEPRMGETFQERASPHTPETPAPGAVARAPKRAHFAIAAALILAIASAGIWRQSTRLPTYSADIGEQRVITLDDGSLIRLNSRSKVRVRLTPQQRNIELLAGQALFQVAKDHTRPFIVNSGDITVRAVGTQFDVYRRKTGTTVTVVEGRVAVLPGGAPHPPSYWAPPSPNSSSTSPQASEQDKKENTSFPLRVRGEGGALREGEASLAAASGKVFLIAAGQQATVTPTGIVQLHPQANIAAATGWLQQELIFTGEPLSVVVDEFNRYSRRTILLDDPSLSQFKINAVFNTTNPQSLLLFLNRMEGVRVNETETEIHIARREPHQ